MIEQVAGGLAGIVLGSVFVYVVHVIRYGRPTVTAARRDNQSRSGQK